MDLEFDVSNQLLTRTDDNNIVNQSQEYLKLDFTFKTNDWTGLSKFALFKSNGAFYKKPIVNNKVDVPNKCLKSDSFIVTIYGLDNEDLRITTNQLKIFLSESGYVQGEGEDDSLDDPTIAEDIYMKLDNTVEMEVTFIDGSTGTYNMVVKDV